MRKLLFLLAAVCCLVINSWAGNTITYTADQKLAEVTTEWSNGLHTNAFNVAISSHTFSGGVGTITFAGELTTIKQHAFHCDNVLSLSIPNSVTTIEAYAFYMVSNVEYSGIAEDPNNWEAKCLNGYIENNLVYSDATKTKLCGCPSYVFGAMTIPNTVTTIGRKAFAYCDGITSITIPNSVTTIEDVAFDQMSSVTELTIPASVTSIGWCAFRGMNNSLTSIRVEEGNPKYDSRDNCNALIQKSGRILILGCVNTVIPNTIDAIGMFAFSGCENLTSISIPTGVRKIRENAFEQAGLTEITLPSSLNNIGTQAFFGCSHLTKITCLATTPPACVGGSYPSFQNVDKSIPVYVPSGSIAAYQSATEWADFTNIQAYTKNYGLYVKGEQVTFDNSGDILGDGTVSYDEISKTLTLNNANITYDDWEVIAIYQDLTINCVGTNTLTTNSDSYSCIMEDVGNVTITGSGSLLVKSDGWPTIYTTHDLTIKNGCTVTAQSANSNAIAIAGEALTVDNATLIAKGNGKATTISSCYDLIMQNGVAICSNHTYDAATHKFLDAAGEEAKDDIVIGVSSTDLPTLPYEGKAGIGSSKYLRNGHLLIEHNNKIYNAIGGRVR